MDDLEKRAWANMPEPIRKKLHEDGDLLEQMGALHEQELRRMSVSITALVEHASLISNKGRRRAQQEGKLIHASIEREGASPDKSTRRP